MKKAFFQLNTGAKIPACGLGTWQASPGEVYTAIKSALAVGYRHIDCASVYQNQKEVGEALAEAFREKIVTRDELFITSKLWCEYTDPAAMPNELENTLRDLRLDYLDLYLIHWPVNMRHGSPMRADEPQPSITDTWRAMCALPSNKAKAVGVSNFSISHLEKIISATGRTPAVNQVEAHPYWRQNRLIDFCQAKGIHVSAYSPLGRGSLIHGTTTLPLLLEHNTVKEIAEKYGRTPAQLILRWNIQRGCSVLPKSVHESRQKENYQCDDFSIEVGDMNQLSAIEPQVRIIQGRSFAKADGWYPTVDDLWK